MIVGRAGNTMLLRLASVLVALTLCGCGGKTPTPEPVESKVLTSREVPSAWLLSVGVSRYKNEGLSLRYAAADATSIDELFASEEGGSVPQTRRWLLRDEEATRENIITALERIAALADERDMIVVFMAMHASAGPDEKLYFYAHDTKPSSLRATGLSDDVVMTTIEGSRAGRLVMLLDACHAGAFDQASAGGERGIQALETNSRLEGLGRRRSSKKKAVLTAASASEVAKEDEVWNGHGVFTHYLLRGLRGEADALETDDGNGDGIVTVQELFTFTYRRVKKDRNNEQHPTVTGAGWLELLKAPRKKASPVVAVTVAPTPSPTSIQPPAPTSVQPPAPTSARPPTPTSAQPPAPTPTQTTPPTPTARAQERLPTVSAPTPAQSSALTPPKPREINLDEPVAPGPEDNPPTSQMPPNSGGLNTNGTYPYSGNYGPGNTMTYGGAPQVPETPWYRRLMRGPANKQRELGLSITAGYLTVLSPSSLVIRGLDEGDAINRVSFSDYGWLHGFQVEFTVNHPWFEVSLGGHGVYGSSARPEALDLAFAPPPDPLVSVYNGSAALSVGGRLPLGYFVLRGGSGIGVTYWGASLSDTGYEDEIKGEERWAEFPLWGRLEFRPICSLSITFNAAYHLMVGENHFNYPDLGALVSYNLYKCN